MKRIVQPTVVGLASAETGLPFDSVAICHLLTALDLGRVQGVGPGGKVSEITLRKVLIVLTDLLEISADTFL